MAVIKFNPRAFEQIRRLPGVEAELRRYVERLLAHTGRTHYVGGVEPGESRDRGYVVTSDFDGMLDNERHATLLRALMSLPGW